MTLVQYLRNFKIRYFGTEKQKNLVKLINENLDDAERAAISGNPEVAGHCFDCAVRLSRRVPQYNVNERIVYLKNNYTMVRPLDSNA